MLFLGFTIAMLRNQDLKILVFAADRPLLFMFLVGAGLAAATLVLPHEHALFAPAWIGLAFLTSSFFFRRSTCCSTTASQTRCRFMHK